MTNQYKTVRSRAWRNLMVAAINVALERRLIGLREGEDYWVGKNNGNDGSRSTGEVFEFSIGGAPAAAYLNDAGYGEIVVHCALHPKEGCAHISAGNAGFSAGEAFAVGWLERRKGAWLQCGSGPQILSCRRGLIEQLAALDIAPLGYADRGKFMM